MTTDEHRAFAKVQARLIKENHMRYGTRYLKNHAAADIGYYETMRRGILTECAFSDFSGIPVSREINDAGDGGADFIMPLEVNGVMQEYKVDVKSKTVRTTWDALRRSGTHLRVQRRELQPMTIYVFGIYLLRTDEAEVLAWEWGHTLLKSGTLMLFKNSNTDEPCYTLPFESLRPLSELADMHAKAKARLNQQSNYHTTPPKLHDRS